MRYSTLLLALAACGSESTTTIPDAPDVVPDADSSERCLVKGDYGALGAVTGTAGSASGATTVTVTLDMGPPRDLFFIRLVPDKGAFTGGLAPGEYTISGADADYNNCGLCVHIIADLVAPQGPSKMYFADAGNVMLTSTTAPIMGTVTNLHFSEVDINSGTKIPGGCEATLALAMFTAQ